MALSWSTMSVWILKKDPFSPFWTDQVIHYSFENLLCGFTDPVSAFIIVQYPDSFKSKLFTSFNPGPAKDFDSCSCPSRVAPSQYLDKKAQDDAIDISVPVNQDMIQCQDKSMPACGGNPWSFCKMCRAYLCVKAIANGEKWLSHIVKEHEID